MEQLWADGLRRGNDALVGLTWTYGKPNDDGHGKIWQLVHHYTHIRTAERNVRRRFRGVQREQYLVETDSWTAYVYYEGTDRLCGVEHLRGKELLDTWSTNSAYGDTLLDLRWEPVATGADAPTGEQLGTVAVDREQPLFPQLTHRKESQGIASWAGLTWKVADGHRRRVADDPIVQRSYAGGSPAYPVVIVDTFEGASVVDRMVAEVPSIDTWIDSLTDELADDSPLGHFSWT